MSKLYFEEMGNEEYNESCTSTIKSLEYLDGHCYYEVTPIKYKGELI